MVQLWFICDAFVVHLWCNLIVIRSVSINDADAFVLHLWCIYGAIMVQLWFICGAFMVILRCIYGAIMVNLWCIYGAIMVHLWCICGAFMVHLWCNLMVIRSVSSNVADQPELIFLMLSEASSFFKTQSLVEVQKTVLITDTFLKKACVLQYTVTQTLSLLGSSKLSRKLPAW